VITPSYDAFRTEFPNNMKAGQAAPVPAFIASASFDMDLDSAPQPKVLGCIVVLMEEDSTPKSSIILGRIAYSKAIEEALNTLFTQRIQSGNTDNITDAEIAAIKSAVKSKVESAIGSNQSIWSKLFTDQDDNLGFAFKIFTHRDTNPNDSNIQFQFFDFPEMKSGSNRFILSGGLSLGPVPTQPTNLCAAPLAALNAKTEEIKSLQNRRSLLQAQLHHATPQQKPGIVDAINETNALITQAEEQLPGLQAAVDACQSRYPAGGAHVDPTIAVDPN
jgi:hypothetical protein